MLANTQMPAILFSFPDVCKTVVGPSVIPIPYPNIAMTVTKIPVIFNHFITCMPAHNLLTFGTISNGNQAGILLGVVSQLIIGPSRYMLGSFKAFFGGTPATKLTSLSGQNGLSMNIPGVSLTPCQVRVILLS